MSTGTCMCGALTPNGHTNWCAHNPTKKGAAMTEAASHWLHANEPDTFEKLQVETQRLQRTLRALIAIGKITESEAERAYEFAR